MTGWSSNLWDGTHLSIWSNENSSISDASMLSWGVWTSMNLRELCRCLAEGMQRTRIHLLESRFRYMTSLVSALRPATVVAGGGSRIMTFRPREPNLTSPSQY